MDWSNYAFMNNYLQNWQQYPMLQYGYGGYNMGFNSYNPYNQYAGYQMPLFNYYPQQNSVNFTGAQGQTTQTEPVKEEKPKMQYVSLNDVGRTKDSKVYEATPEKVAEYDKKRKSLNTKTDIASIVSMIGVGVIAAICLNKNPRMIAAVSDNVERALYSTVLGFFGGAIPVIGIQEVNKSKGEKLVKEYLGEPLDYKA